jgi:beta-lactamase regulating signal transducer with metallopeptidase domain/HEAT repeat protein
MSPVVHAVGWALLHFVWQGALVALIFAVAVRLLRTPDARYTLGVAAMLAMVALPVLTALRYHPDPAGTVGHVSPSVGATADSDVAAAPAARGIGAGATADPEAEAERSDAALTRNRKTPDIAGVLDAALAPIRTRLSLVVSLWLVGVLILSIRLFDAWLFARRLTHDGTSPAPETHRRTLERLSERLGIRRTVVLLESAFLQGPAVVGWLRPVVLLPAVALTGLTPQQVEALIAHELAHVKRHDFLVNLLQSSIETLLFYHPAVWYVSRRVREIREHCCDDVAVRVSGDPEAYARALLGLASARAGMPSLATAASGGALFERVRRILAADHQRAETFPRWMVGAVVLFAAILLGSSSRGLDASPEANAESTGIAAFPADTDKVGADTVRHAPPGPLATRWQWARDEARRRDYRAFWIGYTIEPLATRENRSIYIGRLERSTISGSGVNLRGRIVSFGDFDGFRVPGVRLAPLVGGGMPDDVAILFLYTAGRDGRAVLSRVHASSLVHPVDLEGRAVMWLGQGSDEESVPLVRRLYDEATDREMRKDLVSMVGVHSTSATVVPVLLEWLESRADDEVRGEAVEWLGRHPEPRALNSLARAARRDRSADVRREASESVAEVDLPAATDTLIALARTLEDTDARREAVEGLGERGDDRSVRALADVVRSDPNPDLRREGAESLGESGNPASIALLVEIARTHPDVDVRREAVETIGESAPPAEAVPLLAEIARSDRSIDVSREAIETLGEMKTSAALAIVEELATAHAETDARREAIETRREAVETLGEAAPADRFVVLARELLDANPPAEVWHEVIETLEELEGGAGIPTLIATARSHGNVEIRKHALEALAESNDPRARRLFEDALSR